jgi:hypothetical protein
VLQGAGHAFRFEVGAVFEQLSFDHRWHITGTAGMDGNTINGRDAAGANVVSGFGCRGQPFINQRFIREG